MCACANAPKHLKSSEGARSFCHKTHYPRDFGQLIRGKWNASGRFAFFGHVFEIWRVYAHNFMLFGRSKKHP